MNKKAAIICDIIQSNRLDILAITESWLNSQTNNVVIAEILNILTDYTVLHIPRAVKKGGGIAILARKSFNITMNQNLGSKSFEQIDMLITYKNFNVRIVVIYRPPPSTKNKLTTTQFFAEFSKLTEELTNCNKPLLIAGDFNFHLDDKKNSDACRFIDFLDSANMTQHVSESTHRHATSSIY